MIIIIILSVLLLLFAAIFIIMWVREDDAFLSCILFCVFLLADIISGAVCISNNISMSVESETYELQEQYSSFLVRKKNLENYSFVSEAPTSGVEIMKSNEYYEQIESYNQEVYKFKVSIKEKHYLLKNPWVNWFSNPAYLSITDDMLQQLSYFEA